MTNTINYGEQEAKDDAFEYTFIKILEEDPSYIENYCWNHFDPHITDARGLSLLMLFTTVNDSARAEKLVECGINIHYKNTKGNTALHAGAFSKSCKTVDMLISNGANPSIKNNDHLTACDILVKKDVCASAINHCISLKDDLTGVVAVVYENHNDADSSAW